jgi:hypothetical protein
MLAREYIYAGRFFISHALESAAKWTLKHVQGDVNFGKMSCVNSNLRTATCRCGPLSAIPSGAFADTELSPAALLGMGRAQAPLGDHQGRRYRTL